MMPTPPYAEVGTTAEAVDARGYLGVDRYIASLTGARALRTAFELGLIDRLLRDRLVKVDSIGRALAVDDRGLALLLGLLEANGVIERHDDAVALQPEFLEALRYRELMEVKLDFAGFAMVDFAELLTVLVKDPAAFRQRSRLFQLFDYARCFDATLESYVRAKRWMRLTTILTRYEAAACLGACDLGAHRRLLDVGGNSGEFALQVCRRYPALSAAVIDLPLVCEIGLEHVLAHAERDRVAFIKADFRHEPIPPGYDLISFKSMLHDWPDKDALGFLGKAVASLSPGGTVLIFERKTLPAAPLGFSDLPVLLFGSFYRDAGLYTAELRRLGMTEVRSIELGLDTPFMLISARKSP